MAVVDRVRELAAPIVASRGMALYDVEHNGGVVRVLVDAPSDRPPVAATGDSAPEGSGIEVGALQKISRELARVLDEVDPVPGRYTLEVSSPGLERPLRTPEHFRTALGTDIKVKLFPGVDGDRRVAGELIAVDDDGIDVATGEGSRHVAFSDVAKARTVFEWGPTPPPGGKSRNPRSTDPNREAPTS